MISRRTRQSYLSDLLKSGSIAESAESELNDTFASPTSESVQIDQMKMRDRYKNTYDDVLDLGTVEQDSGEKAQDQWMQDLGEFDPSKIPTMEPNASGPTPSFLTEHYELPFALDDDLSAATPVGTSLDQQQMCKSTIDVHTSPHEFYRRRCIACDSARWTNDSTISYICDPCISAKRYLHLTTATRELYRQRCISCGNAYWTYYNGAYDSWIFSICDSFSSQRENMLWAASANLRRMVGYHSHISDLPWIYLSLEG